MAEAGSLPPLPPRPAALKDDLTAPPPPPPPLPPRPVHRGSSMIDDYVYTPINSADAEIRLLKLHADAKVALGRKKLPPIRVSLKTCLLPIPNLSRGERVLRSAKLPVYEALSYRWGDPSKTHEAVVDGKRIGITKNLYTALRDIQADSVGSLHIWVDAICINQDDLQERSAQILLMKQVYFSACWVKIWLGPVTEDGRRCSRYIQKSTSTYTLVDSDSESDDDQKEDKYLSQRNKFEEVLMKPVLFTGGAVVQGIYAVANAGYQINDLLGESVMQEATQELLLDRPGTTPFNKDKIESLENWKMPSRYWKSIQHENFKEIAQLIGKTFLEDCEWFSRMWVVQEMGVACDCEILYNGKTITIDNFLRSIYYLHHKLDAPVPHIQRIIGLELIRTGWGEGKRQALFDLILECRYRDATDPRDKIFSLLGLMGDRMDDLLKPDYTKSVGEVYANATFHFIIQFKSLAPLCGWQMHDRDKNIPSWIPDFSLNQEAAPSRLISREGCEYNASGHDYRSEYVLKRDSINDDWRHLPVQGITMGTLSILSDPTTGERPFSDIEDMWHASLLAARSLLKDLTGEVMSCLDRISILVKVYSKIWELRQQKIQHTNLAVKQFEWSHSAEDLLKDSTHEGKLEASTLGTYLHKDNIVSAYIQTLLCGRFSPRERLTDANIDLIMGMGQHQLSATDAVALQKTVPEAFEFGLRRRRLGILNDGHIGAMPEQVQLGDIVCVLLGCSVPVVLRKQDGGGYSFIGECYLHGLMDGEAIALQIKGQYKVEEYALS